MIQNFIAIPFREIHVEQNEDRAAGVFIGFHRIEKLYRRMTVRDNVHIRFHFGSLQGLPDQEYIRIAILDDKNIRQFGISVRRLGQ